MDNHLIFEIRQAADPTRESAGRLVGTLLKYGEIAQDRNEVFARGALSWPAAGILINAMHERTRPLLRAVPFNDGDEVKIDAAVPPTAAGRDAITNIREGVYSGLSIEFHSKVERRRGNLREIRQAYLGAAALVDVAAYGGSTVEVRARSDSELVEAALRWL